MIDNTERQEEPKLCRLVTFSSLLHVVGYTHEDIDQMFSCYARRLSKHDAKTLPELMEEIQASSSPSVKVKLLQSLFNVKEWMSGHVGDLTGHTPQHQFKIVRNKDGKAEVS